MPAGPDEKHLTARQSLVGFNHVQRRLVGQRAHKFGGGVVIHFPLTGETRRQAQSAAIAADVIVAPSACRYQHSIAGHICVLRGGEFTCAFTSITREDSFHAARMENKCHKATKECLRAGRQDHMAAAPSTIQAPHRAQRSPVAAPARLALHTSAWRGWAARPRAGGCSHERGEGSVHHPRSDKRRVNQRGQRSWSQ